MKFTYTMLMWAVMLHAVDAQLCDLIPGEPCSCRMSDGSGVITLQSLSNSDGTPAFPDTYAFDGYYYSFNPCTGFNQGSCQNAAGCQISGDQVSQYTIGDISSEYFVYVGDSAHLIYSHTDDTGFFRFFEIKLVCDSLATTPIFVVDGETEPGSGTYLATLTTKCACPDGCVGAPNPPNPNPKPGGQTGEGGGLTPGSVMCIIFFSLVFVYIVGGVIFQKSVKKASGRDVIPNAGFWTTLPGLIKDGFSFTYQRIFCRS